MNVAPSHRVVKRIGAAAPTSIGDRPGLPGARHPP